MRYTGGWEDLAVLGIFSIVGMSCKYFKFSRPAMLMGFILADKIESLSLQMIYLYTPSTLIVRPLFIGIMTLVIAMFIYGVFFNKNRLDYS